MNFVFIYSGLVFEDSSDSTGWFYKWRLTCVDKSDIKAFLLKYLFPFQMNHWIPLMLCNFLILLHITAPMASRMTRIVCHVFLDAFCIHHAFLTLFSCNFPSHFFMIMCCYKFRIVILFD